MNYRKITIIVLSFSKYLVTKKQHGDKSDFGKNPNSIGSEEGGDWGDGGEPQGYLVGQADLGARNRPDLPDIELAGWVLTWLVSYN